MSKIMMNGKQSITLYGSISVCLLVLMQITNWFNYAAAAPPSIVDSLPPLNISESSQQIDCDCHWRYLKHYRAKGCTPVYGPEPCRCPVRFDCPNNFLETNDGTKCLVDGREYSVGATVNTSNNCEICHCRLDPVTNRAALSCVLIECANAFGPRLPEGCYLIYDQARCCPVGSKCVNETEANEPVCRHAGKDYKLGQKIYPEEDACLICLCTREWRGIDGPGCRRHDCQIQRELHQLRAGCIPIYHEKTCCPIEYHCGSDENHGISTNTTEADPNADVPEQCRPRAQFGSCQEAFPRFYFNSHRRRCEEFLFSGCGGNDNKFTTRADCENVCGTGRNALEERRKGPTAEQCAFQQRHYAVGEILDINHPTHCVTCTCSVPPDFTCIHRSCPPPPGNNYENCTAKYKTGACCPQYTCGQGQGEGEILSLRAPNLSQSTSAVPDKPTCPKDFSCSPGCTPAPPSPSGDCPTPSCTCPVDHKQDRESCIPPMNCIQPGCALESAGGQCPTCVCHKEEPGSSQNRSREVTCGRLQCNPGCSMDDQVPVGACPGCMCGQDNQGAVGDGRSVREARSCLPVNPRCTERPGCRIVITSDGCTECSCTSGGTMEPCYPPTCQCPLDAKCPEYGCNLYTNTSSPSQCSVCKCSNGRSLGHSTEERLQCPSASKCPDSCQLTSSTSGNCPTCRCEGIQDARPCLPPLCLCEPPRCEPGCRPDRRVPLGRCPGCVCDLIKLDGARTSSSEKEYNRETIESNKSNKRPDNASPECKPLHCESPCKPELRPPSGQCPSCICRFEEDQQTAGYPPNYGREGTETHERRYKGHGETQNGRACPVIANCNTPACKVVSVNDKCPECICTSDERTQISQSSSSPNARCPPADCHGEGCRAVSSADGCPKCECRQQGCPDNREEETNCQDPCEWQAKPRRGGCPRCLCPKENPQDSSGQRTPITSRKCPNVSNSACEGKDCRLVPGSDGCPTCSCRQLECGTQPSCYAPCTLENPSNGRCPICVCPAEHYGG